MGRFLDGGLLSNNPTLDAMTEIHQYNKALKAEVVQSTFTHSLTHSLTQQYVLNKIGLCNGKIVFFYILFL